MEFSSWERWRLAGISANTTEDAAKIACFRHNNRSNVIHCRRDAGAPRKKKPFHASPGAPWCVWACCLLILILLCSASGVALDLTTVTAGLQRRYQSVETISGSFQQTYHAPGVDQAESGVFWLKKPALMRWEYRIPEEQLFVADGRESFLYVPQDRQVTIQPLTASDLHNTPLEFLLGARDISKSFAVSWETEYKPKAGRTVMLRLTPRVNSAAYRFLVLELDQAAFDIRRIVIGEPTGNTMEFLLSNLATNEKIDTKKFQFKPPKGVEILRLGE
jgi:outer membrane lipoprotein carrier protein